MVTHYYRYLVDSNLIYWFGIPILLIVIMATYSQLRKRRSTEN